MGHLVVSLGSLPVLALELPPGIRRLGRLRDNDIVLPLPEVADLHATIARDEHRVLIRAAAGERLARDGRSVTEADLTDGRPVTLGAYRLRWIGADPGQAAAPVLESAPVEAGHLSTAEAPPPVPLAVPVPGEGGLRLRVVAGPDTGREAALNSHALVIGRAPDCDLVLHDDTVSWRHCSVERTATGVRLRDLESRNGTFIDDRRIEVAVAGPDGRIRVGRSMLVFAGPCAGAMVNGDPACMAEMIGRGPAMRKVFARLREVAANRSPVLLLGPTGTGKELAARAIHSLGPRTSGPFVPLNCAAAPRDLIEDMLFGHARGAYTGAAGDRRGAFERANRGTIFLDEIGELPADLQPKLLRVLEDGTIPRLGGAEIRSDFRVVAASNRDLPRDASQGGFRADLYYRLAVLEIRLPPLHARLEDLPDLLHNFLAVAGEQCGIAGAAGTRIAEDALDPLRRHNWPGNVRELRNLVVRALARRPGGLIDRPLIEELLADAAPAGAITPQSLAAIEIDAIRNALRVCNGQRRAAARRLGIAESTLYEKIRRHGLAEIGGGDADA